MAAAGQWKMTAGEAAGPGTAGAAAGRREPKTDDVLCLCLCLLQPDTPP